ncbi:MAG: tetratricopeptide repeat protein [Longimicrobiales bacterium]|nr:tetratricopeptide repeat protein [Longimicrobiales bacterium]
MRVSWNELRERKIVQWTLAYLASAWVVYEVLSQIGDNFAWPPVVLRVVTVVLATGLPIVLVVAWYHGERGQQRVALAEVALVVAALALGYVGVRWVLVGAETGDPGPVEARDEGVLLNSLAVLPLRNLSGDPSQEYFADGLTEELMGALGRVPGLRLSARTSSFAFKGRDVGVDSVSLALRVRHLLDGSVLRQGDSLRVSIALIDARANYELWSRTYRRPAEDVFSIEQDVARSVVEALPLDPVLLDADWRLPDNATSLEAFELYLLGKEAWNQRTGPSLLRSIELFEQALAIDSTFVPAWAALAETYVVLPGYTAVSGRTSFERLKETARRALALDSLNVQAHTALGYGTVWAGRDFQTGMRLLDRALEIDPDYANALHWQGEVLAHAGRFEEAWARFELALEVDPLSHVTVADYGQALQLAGRNQAAIEVLDELLERAPGYLIGEYWLFYPALMEGHYERAEALIRSVARRTGLDPDGMARAVRAVAGEIPREAGIAALDAQPRTVSGVGVVAVSALYGQLGAVEKGFELMTEKATNQVHIYLVTHPIFEPYRSHPRYERLVDAVNIRG